VFFEAEKRIDKRRAYERGSQMHRSKVELASLSFSDKRFKLTNKLVIIFCHKMIRDFGKSIICLLFGGKLLRGKNDQFSFKFLVNFY
jgi:dephospho-CoA kinase